MMISLKAREERYGDPGGCKLLLVLDRIQLAGMHLDVAHEGGVI